MASRVCVVIPACNEADRITRLLQALKRWIRRPDIVVIANGCSDDTVARARRFGVTVVEFPEPLGHDVGRAIGLAAIQADIYVVVDADIACTPRELEPYVRAVEGGVDLALNRYPLAGTKAYRHPTSIAKRTLNLFLGRPDLMASSLTSVPHAVSRRAVMTLGPEAFAVPPVAQTLAITQGLRVENVAHVAVGARNPLRAVAHRRAMRDLILGDCLEAMHTLIGVRGSRGGFTDLGRNRLLLEELANDVEDAVADERLERTVVAVVPVRNEAKSIRVVVSRLRAGVTAVCVVSNGSSDGTSALANRVGATVHEFADPLGHDVGRAVGCMRMPAYRYLFTDGDFALSQRDLQPFLRPRGAVDVALNEFDRIVPPEQQKDAVSVVKRFLNIAVNRSDLGAASLTAIPHSIGRHVVEAIGVESLAVPPVAQVKAMLQGFRVEAVHPVDVVKPNRIRLALHGRKGGKPLERMIIGDHLEAVACLLGEKGPRGGYDDKARQRGAVRAWLDSHP